MVITVTGAGTVCANGALRLSPDMFTYDDLRTFYNTYMAAKAAGIKMKVFYNNSTGTCDIYQFGLGASQ